MEQAENALQNGQGDNQNGTPKMYNVKVWMDANGNPIMQEVAEDELINGYLRQQDYTKKTQELAEERKLVTAKASQAHDAWYQWNPNDEEAVDAFLSQKGYVKATDVETLVEKKLQWMTKAQQDEQKLKELISANPDLKQFEWAIRTIATTDNSALEDIVVKYGFSNHDKLSKAKKQGLVWWAKFEDSKPKPPSEWTDEEWAKYDALNKRPMLW